MADLLLELFSEEIPARMQGDALAHLQKTLVDKLTQQGIPTNSGSLTGFVTPRRLAVWLKNLPIEQAATEIELKGPKTNAPEAALQGFLKKTGLTQDQLEMRDGIYFATIKKTGQRTADVLKTIIEDTLATFPWPKSMRWGSGSTPWVRPLHSILCLFNNHVIPVQFAGVTASNITHGHRFLAPEAIVITTPETYEVALKAAYVIANRDTRKALILSQAQTAAKAAGVTLKPDPGLLEEVTGLIEYPTILTGTIDAQFMDLPGEVLISEMRAHQKYFALLNQDGTLSSKFLITANIPATDEGRAIIAGNERVLRARLADGRFFWDQDRKKPLVEWAENLKTVTFHVELGTIADKVDRIAQLAALLAPSVSADKVQVWRAAQLAKADLVTGMVGEFPELQGIMGRYYAQQGELSTVADAIRDHYKPQGPGDAVPTQPIAICVALADKIDTLVGMFAIGEKPTGSKDPYALRRAALGIIRIILDNDIRQPLEPILLNASVLIAQYFVQKNKQKGLAKLIAAKHQLGNAHLQTVKAYSEAEEKKAYELIPPVGEPINPEQFTSDVGREVLQFFYDRLKVQLKDQGIRHDIINAVTVSGDDDLLRIRAKARALQDFLSNEDGKNLLAGYIRASGILSAEEKKDKKTYEAYTSETISAESFHTPEEAALQQQLSFLSTKISNLIAQEQFVSAMIQLSTFRSPLDQFFTNLLVNDADPQTRERRLRLLATVRATMDQIASFARIEN